MKLPDLFRRRPVLKRDMDLNDPRLWTILGSNNALPGTALDYATTAGDLWLTSLVGPLLGWAGRNIGQASPAVYVKTKGGDSTDEPLDTHPLIDVLERPGRTVSFSALMGATITSLEAGGNAYWLKQRANAGQPAGFQWFPHYAVEPLRGADGGPGSYKLRTTSGYQTWPAEEVIHFRMGIDPRNDMLGLSPLYPVLREIVGDTEAGNWLVGLLKNSAVPGLLLVDKMGALDDTQRRALKGTLDERVGGDKRGSSLVVSGDLGVERLGSTPVEFGVADLRKHFETRVCAAVGLNPVVVGFLAGIENATDNKQEEYHASAWQDFLMPLLNVIGDALTVQALPDYGRSDGLYLGWDTSSVLALQEDRDAVAKRAVTGYQGGLLTRNEARLMMGLDEDTTDVERDAYYKKPTPEPKEPEEDKSNEDDPSGKDEVLRAFLAGWQNVPGGR